MSQTSPLQLCENVDLTFMTTLVWVLIFLTTLAGALRTPHEKHGGHAASPPLTRNNSLYFRGLLHAQIHNLYDQIGS